jgi:hypothetical protein
LKDKVYSSSSRTEEEWRSMNKSENFLSFQKLWAR